MKRKPLTLAIAFVLLVIFGLMLFVYQVRPSEAAIITYFGRVARVKTDPGPGLRLPFIETVHLLDERIQNFDSRLEEIKLQDNNIILLSVYVGYRISDPTNFFAKFLNGSIAEANKTLAEIVSNIKNQVGSRHHFPDFISADGRQMKFAQIEQEMLNEVQQKALNYGVEFKFIQIQKISLPDTVTQNVFERMTSERQYYATNIQSQGELESAKIRSTADGIAAKLLYDAQGQAFIIKGEGEAQMFTNLSVMNRDPGLATFNMQMEAMSQLLKSKATLILDSSTSPLEWLKMNESSKKDK